MSVEVNLKMKVRDFKQLSDFLGDHEYDIYASINDYGDLKQLFKLVFDVEPSNGQEALKGVKINTNDIKNMLVASQKPTGKFFASAKLYFYRIDTSIDRSIYSNEDLSHALPNPVIADCNGDFPSIFVNPDDGSYRIMLTDGRGNILLIKDYLVTIGE
jgi:hypothetical protein